MDDDYFGPPTDAERSADRERAMLDEIRGLREDVRHVKYLLMAVAVLLFFSFGW